MNINSAIERIADLSFKELITLIPRGNLLRVNATPKLQVDSDEHQTIMITISSSIFRIAALLHAPILRNQQSLLTPLLDLNEQLDLDRQYLDYLSELSNNLGGISARMIRTAGYSTGLSQPAILKQAYDHQVLCANSPNHLLHFGSYLDDQLCIAASYSLFINKNVNSAINLDINEIEDCIDNSGELEFF